MYVSADGVVQVMEVTSGRAVPALCLYLDVPCDCSFQSTNAPCGIVANATSMHALQPQSLLPSETVPQKFASDEQHRDFVGA